MNCYEFVFSRKSYFTVLMKRKPTRYKNVDALH